ncbi:MAG: hypothetical protein GY765_24100 [bacterium]|nr:hypothetical protein [bacterium]
MKTRVIYLVLLIVLLTAGGIQAAPKKAAVVLPEIMKPAMMKIHRDKLYILQKTTIFIYSLPDFKLIKEFGREGEGPGEFKARPYGPPMTMSFSGKQLAVNSNTKVSYFSVTGDYKNEKRAPHNKVLYQFGDQVVAICPAPDKENRERITYFLLSGDFKKVKTLFETDIYTSNESDLMLPLTSFTYNPVHKDRIIMAGSSGEFVIDIKDGNGNIIHRFEKDYKRIKIPGKYKTDTLHWFKTDPEIKQLYQKIRTQIKFKEYFPAIRDILADNGIIYVITYKNKNNSWECIHLDMTTGKELKRSFIPLSEYIPFTYYPLLYTIKDGKAYSLLEDSEEENWEIHTTDIR